MGCRITPRGLVKTYCVRCHSPEKHQADVDLAAIRERPNSLAGRKTWQKVLEQLKNEEMPPRAPPPSGGSGGCSWRGPKRHPMAIDWTKIRNPGRVTIPRLTRQEYNHTLRRPARNHLNPRAQFWADRAGASGFNTDRDALFLTPALLEKYSTRGGGGGSMRASRRNKSRRRSISKPNRC